MDVGNFINKTYEKGFDTVAALSLSDIEKALGTWKKYLREGDFLSYLITDPRDILPEAASVLVFAYPYRTFKGYPEGAGRVSGYYVASNRAFHALCELTAILNSHGILAVQSHKLPHKPLALAAGIGRYGKNGIIVRAGSHVVLGVIIADFDFSAQIPRAAAQIPDCEHCGVCEKSCPSSCLCDGYVNTSRCLRSYMTNKQEEIPDDLFNLMGERLLGCDECLNSCPGLTFDPVPPEFQTLFKWETLADKDEFAKNKQAIAEIVGINNTDALHKNAVLKMITRC